MTVLLLVSGSLRSFRENLCRMGNYDIAVYIALDDEDTYLNPENLKFVLEEPRMKTILIERMSDIPQHYKEERQKNTYKQWYKLSRLWQSVPKTYDTYVRIRPDICLESPHALENLLHTSHPLVIPMGNDRDGINDQIATGSAEAMAHYCDMFHHLHEYRNISSESMLAHHLRDVPVARMPLQYKLVLSTAKVISIAGDSGSGKSTLCQLIRPLFLFDKVLEFETDRYHKWERGDTHWRTTTHLHPEANYLEKLEDDTFNLKIGNTVVAVDYDHSTGTFTPPKTIEPKETMILCGLHTLYSKQLRTLSDLKIYVDTSDELKTQWKLQRDTCERGHDASSVLAKIASRRSDYDTHVAPQRDYADLIVRFHTDNSLTLTSKHREWFAGLPGEHGHDCITFRDPSVDVRKQVYEFLWSLDLPHVEAKTGYNGVLQCTILRALYTKHG